jgi:ankyrin repeat protein
MSKIRGNTDVEYELAVRQGNARRIQTLMKNNIRPPKRMMLFALLQKHPEILPVLKQAGCNPNDADGFHNTALGHAIKNYPLEIVKTLLDMGANPNQETTHLLPLVWVSYDDEIECVKILLNAGANPNLPQHNGVIPLHAAVRRGQYQVVKLFVESGADPKIKGPDKKNSIELAALSKRTDLVKLLKLFVKANQKPKIKAPRKRSALAVSKIRK